MPFVRLLAVLRPIPAALWLQSKQIPTLLLVEHGAMQLLFDSPTQVLAQLTILLSRPQRAAA